MKYKIIIRALRQASLILLLTALASPPAWRSGTAFGQKILFDDGVSYEAETLIYKTRVLADGGEIINLDAVNDAIKDAEVNSFYDSLYCWYDANFGLKKDANNKVIKLYNLIGTSDAAIADTSLSPTWYADSLGGKATLKFTDDRLATAIPLIMTYGFSGYFVVCVQSTADMAVMGQTAFGTQHSFRIVNGATMNTFLGGSVVGTNAFRTGDTRAIFTNNIVGMSTNPADSNRTKHYSNGATVATTTLSAPELTWNGQSVIFGATRETVIQPFIGNISSIILSKDIITEPAWLNTYYSVY